MNFKCVCSNQIKKYEYIQDIWEMQNFMQNTMTKNFWRARTSARASRIFCLLGSNLMILKFSQRYEVWCAPRAKVRARQFFFVNINFVQKSLYFFWFVHSSKIEDFGAIWCLVIFWKFDFFFQKIFKFWDFFEKNRFFKNIIKLQIALKFSLFELWTNQKNCNEIFQQSLH